MIELKKIGIPEIKLIVDYLFQNQDKIEKVDKDFGQIEDQNGYEKLFLTTSNSFLKAFYR